MSWAGYFCKIGSKEFPNKLIAGSGIISTPNQQTDQDSYVDGNGLLHRNKLSHLRSGFKITTTELTLAQKISISDFYSTGTRTKVSITYWNDETNSYSTGSFYAPSVDWTIKKITSAGPIYDGVTLEFVEY